MSRSLVGWRGIVVVEQEGWAASGLSAPLASPGLSFYFARQSFCSRFRFRRFGTRVRALFFVVNFFGRRNFSGGRIFLLPFQA